MNDPTNLSPDLTPHAADATPVGDTPAEETPAVGTPIGEASENAAPVSEPSADNPSAEPASPTPPAAKQRTVRQSNDKTPKGSKSRGKIPLRIFIMLIGSAFLLFLLAVGITAAHFLMDRPARIESRHSFLLLEYPEHENAIVYYDGRKVGKPLPGVVEDAAVTYSVVSTSANGKTALIYGTDGTLYVATDKKIIRVTDDFGYIWDTNRHFRFAISANGRYVAYAIDNVLYRYRVGRNAERGVKEVTDEYGGESFCLSPDGKYLAFGDEHASLMVYDGKDIVDKGSNRIPLAISDDALYIYSKGTRGGFYVMTEEGEVKIGDDEQPTLLFNHDRTEVLYISNDRVSLSVEGAKPQKLDSGSATSVSFKEYICYDTVNIGFSLTYESGVVPTDTFIGQYFLMENDDLMYINKDLSATKVGDDVQSFVQSDNGKICYFIDQDGVLYRTPKAGKKGVAIAEDVDQVVVTNNGKSCYYLHDTDLWYVEKTDDPRQIDTDVGQMFLSRDDYLFYMVDITTAQGGSVQEGDLYASHEGGKSERIERGVNYCALTSTGFLYLSDYDVDPTEGTSCIVNFTREGTRFKKLGEDARPPMVFRN